MYGPDSHNNSLKKAPNRELLCLEKEELAFWERQKRSGEDCDLKMARDLPDDTPEFILRLQQEFEENAAAFCFAGSRGMVLDAGCGNGELLTRALESGLLRDNVTGFVGMDFSPNMLSRARCRASNDPRGAFIRASVNCLPLQDQSIDRIACSGVLTCLASTESLEIALQEFNRVLRPGGILVADFFNRLSHYTLARRHLFQERIQPPEYLSFAEFADYLKNAGFKVESYLGFDYKPCQGYLFMSRYRPVVDPAYLQERMSRFMERKVIPAWPRLSLLGYRIYVRSMKI